MEMVSIALLSLSISLGVAGLGADNYMEPVHLLPQEQKE
jgi:hypothetical protein